MYSEGGAACSIRDHRRRSSRGAARLTYYRAGPCTNRAVCKQRRRCTPVCLPRRSNASLAFLMLCRWMLFRRVKPGGRPRCINSGLETLHYQTAQFASSYACTPAPPAGQPVRAANHCRFSKPRRVDGGVYSTRRGGLTRIRCCCGRTKGNRYGLVIRNRTRVKKIAHSYTRRQRRDML